MYDIECTLLVYTMYNMIYIMYNVYYTVVTAICTGCVEYIIKLIANSCKLVLVIIKCVRERVCVCEREREREGERER